MVPDEVNEENEQLVRERLYPEKSKHKIRWRLNIGDHVRMTSTRQSAFSKGYTQKWTREIFVVSKHEKTDPPHIGYRI